MPVEWRACHVIGETPGVVNVEPSGPDETKECMRRFRPDQVRGVSPRCAVPHVPYDLVRLLAFAKKPTQKSGRVENDLSGYRGPRG